MNQEDAGYELIKYEVTADASVEKLGVTFAGLPPGHLKVTAVADDGWGRTQEIEPGDRLLKLNGVDLRQMDADTFKREAKERPLKLTLAEGPEEADPQRSSDGGQEHEIEIIADSAVKKIGMAFGQLPPGPVTVKTVAAGGWAETRNVVPGDVLVEMNGKDLEHMDADTFKHEMQMRPLSLILMKIEHEDVQFGTNPEEKKRSETVFSSERAQEARTAQAQAEQLRSELAEMQADLQTSRNSAQELRQKLARAEQLEPDVGKAGNDRGGDGETIKSYEFELQEMRRQLLQVQTAMSSQVDSQGLRSQLSYNASRSQHHAAMIPASAACQLGIASGDRSQLPANSALPYNAEYPPQPLRQLQQKPDAIHSTRYQVDTRQSHLQVLMLRKAAERAQLRHQQTQIPGRSHWSDGPPRSS